MAGMPGSSQSVEAFRVSKIFGDGQREVRALGAVDVSIRENEFFTLLGPSGCGKTTLLRLIAGFDHPTSGHILLHGEEISHLPPHQRPVNTVFQSYALFPHMTVAENIGFGLKMQGRPASEVSTTVRDMLRLVRMEELADRRTNQISGGQQQRVALARALAPHPRVLLLDEPLSALDYKLRKEMQIELKRLQNETGITFVFVTHDQEEALTMSDRIAVMNAGKILQIGTSRDIYDHPSERFVADFIGDTNFIPVDLIARSGTGGTIRFASGVEMEVAVPSEVSSGGTVTIAVRPEHAELGPLNEDAVLSGTLGNVVYVGTDTHYHVHLPTSGEFVVRQQNARDAVQTLSAGGEIGVRFGPGSVQVLRD